MPSQCGPQTKVREALPCSVCRACGCARACRSEHGGTARTFALSDFRNLCLTELMAQQLFTFQRGLHRNIRTHTARRCSERWTTRVVRVLPLRSDDRVSPNTGARHAAARTPAAVTVKAVITLCKWQSTLSRRLVCPPAHAAATSTKPGLNLSMHSERQAPLHQDLRCQT